MKIRKLMLRKIKRLAIKIFGSKTDEIYWQFRHIFDKKWAKSYLSRDSLFHPHRKLLIDRISTYYPFDNVLEIGSAPGPNLYLLAKKFPKVKFYGIDISKKAIEAVREYFKKYNIQNIFLNSGKAEELNQFKEKSIDIIFTDAALIYIAPDKIEKVLKEIFRVAKKAIVFNEWHSNSSRSFYDDIWVYNYRILLGKFLPEEKIKLTKIPESIWSGNWAKYGYIIEASF